MGTFLCWMGVRASVLGRAVFLCGVTHDEKVHVFPRSVRARAATPAGSGEVKGGLLSVHGI